MPGVKLRRLSIGMLIGLIAAGLELMLFRLATPGPTLAESGGVVGLLMVGLVIGGIYPLLFQPVPGGQGENLMGGAVLGLAAWAIIALNLQPVLMGSGPMWQVTAALSTLPQLIAYVLQGGVIGLIDGLVYQRLAERLGLAELPVDTAPPPITTRVVILGGGYAGVTAAQTLENELEDDPTVGIWLVSETNHLLFTPMLAEVSASAVDPQHIGPPLRSFFRRTQVVRGTVERVDLARRVVCLAADARSPRRELPFDHLVLALGSVPNFFGNEAIARAAFTFKSLEDAVLVRNQVIDMFERADVETDPAKRRRMLTFVVAGGGYAGVELLGGLNDFARSMLRYYPNIPPEELRLILVHARETILPELSAGLGEYARQKLEGRGVEFKLKVRVTGARSGAVLLGDETLPTETFIWTAGNQPSPILATLGLLLDKSGRLQVTPALAVPGQPGLWAAGDCALVPDVITGAFCPPTAQHALRQAKTLGHNIARAIKGQPLKTFKFKTIGSLAALGHQLAVAEVYGYRFSGFLAWLMWRGIYLSKLPNMEKRVRVGIDWLVDIFFPRDIVQTIDFGQPKMAPTEPVVAPVVEKVIA